MTLYRCWVCGGRHHSLDCPRLDDEQLMLERGEVNRRALLALRRIHRQLQERER